MRAILLVLDFRLRFANCPLYIRLKYGDGRGSGGGVAHGVGLVGRGEVMTIKARNKYELELT